jgi:predicted GNAT family N-acyltransferase
LYAEEQQLRNNVLLIPYGLPPHYWEMNDSVSSHLCLIEIDEEKRTETMVACLLLFPVKDCFDTVQLMQMAVKNDQQGKGLGKKLVDEAKRVAVSKGYSKINGNIYFDILG